MEVTPQALARLFEVMSPQLDERQRRLLVGSAAVMLGRGGQARVTEASGMSRSTVITGMREVTEGAAPSGRVRAPGAGPKSLIDTQPGLAEALDELVHPETRGNPMSLLRWTSKSTANLAKDLVRRGFEISDDTVGRILKGLGYSLQSPAKVKEGTSHPDRDGLGSTTRPTTKAGSAWVTPPTPRSSRSTPSGRGGTTWATSGSPTPPSC